MTIQLIPSSERIAAGDQVTYEIQGLEPRERGVYIVRWTIEPRDRLTPVGDDVRLLDDGLYSRVRAEEATDRAGIRFDVRESGPVTVRVDVRHRENVVSFDQAPDEHRAADEDPEFIATHSFEAMPSALPDGGGTGGPAATAASARRARTPGRAGGRGTGGGALGPAAASARRARTPGRAGGRGTGGGALGAAAASARRARTPGRAGGGGGTGAGGTTAAAASAPRARTPRPLAVSMQRAAITPTASQALWTLIRQSANALSFQNYQAFLEHVLCGASLAGGGPSHQPAHFPRPVQASHQLPWSLPFPGVQPYRQLKAATEVFVMLNCGVPFDRFMHGNPPFMSPTQQWSAGQVSIAAQLQDEGDRYNRPVNASDIQQAWAELLAEGQQRQGGVAHPIQTILYLALVRANLSDVHVRPQTLDLSPQAAQELDHGAVTCMGILQEKLANPCFIELIWSYWQEEAGLVQTMNAITWRFQNRRGAEERDPLASLEIDPLRPLNNFLWGYIQDEEHRLSVVRRAYEYAHHYGLTLLGKAVPEIRGADNRSHFIESLHNLLHLCSIFYKEDDDTTVVADGFPLLNALKEVHLLLTQGAANQYGDLPWTARLEMLMQQWLLARPEFREFLPRRIMVDYPEEWMSSVETMKTVQGWHSASVLHFRDLAVFGEQIVLSIRFQAWPSVIEAQDAANWARYWRPEIQGYIYAYRAVTGVDVTERPDATAPSLLLRQRMQQSLPTSRTALARPKPVAQLPMPSRLEERGGR